MKLSSFLFVLLLYPGLLLAQQTKTMEQSFRVPADKEATMNLKFARSITVKTWNKNEIVLKTIAKYSNEDYLSWHTQEVSEAGGRLSIETGFKKDKGVYNYKDQQCWDCDNSDCYCLSYSYEVYAPSNVLLELETISGDLDLTAWASAIKAKSISGFIDLALSPSAKRSIRLKSVTGEVYTDLSELRLDEDSNAYSKKMNRQFNGGGDIIQLETVSGDIFLRRGR